MRSSVSSSSFCLFPFWFSLLLLALPRLVLIRNFLAKNSYPSPRTLFVHRHCVRRPSWYFEEISKTKRNRLFSQLPPFYSKPAIRISFASLSHLLRTRNGCFSLAMCLLQSAAGPIAQASPQQSLSSLLERLLPRLPIRGRTDTGALCHRERLANIELSLLGSSLCISLAFWFRCHAFTSLYFLETKFNLFTRRLLLGSELL